MTLRTKFVLLLVAFSAFLIGSVASAAWAIGLYLDASMSQFRTASGLIDEVDGFHDEIRDELARCLQQSPPPIQCVTPRLADQVRGLQDQLRARRAKESEPGAAHLLGVAVVRLRGQYAQLRELKLNGDPQMKSADLDLEENLRADLDLAITEIKTVLSREAQAAAADADAVQRNVLVIMVANAAAGLLLALMGSLMVQRWVTRPIQELQHASRQFADGNLAHRAPVHGSDELGLLATQFNDMAGRLAESQRRLVERERMAAVGELCSAVAHGIRNPLSAIASSAELMLAHGRIDEPTRRRIRDVLAESGRLNQRVTRLLEFARTRQMNNERLAVAEIVTQAATEMFPRLTQLGVRVEQRFPERPLFVRGDRDVLVNALIELITNAAEQPAAEAVVTLSCQERGGRAAIEVRDRGPGFSEHTRGRVFNLFFTTKENGTGIGLASVRKAVELHEGEVCIDNAEGGGAIVTILLPRSASDRSASPSPPPPPPAAAPRRRPR